MPAGRPRKEINWDEFDKLCSIQCTQEEIASWFNCSVDTIERAVEREHGVKFAEYYAQNSGTGKISLRRQQWQLALKGDKTMLIWLGKQHLGQMDRAQLDISKVDNQTFLEEAKRRLLGDLGTKEVTSEVDPIIWTEPGKTLLP